MISFLGNSTLKINLCLDLPQFGIWPSFQKRKLCHNMYKHTPTFQKWNPNLLALFGNLAILPNKVIPSFLICRSQICTNTLPTFPKWQYRCGKMDLSEIFIAGLVHIYSRRLGRPLKALISLDGRSTVLAN